jgi:Type IV secretion system pilin
MHNQENVILFFVTLMKNYCVYAIIVFWITFSSFWFASVDNSKSVFTDPSDSGQAKWVNLIDTNTQQKDAFVNVVKWAVNWVLGILALIALLVIMYWWFQMVTSAWNEDSYNKWFTILKYAAIGLVLIGVAWFIVSIIFWLVNQSASNAWDSAWTG